MKKTLSALATASWLVLSGVFAQALEVGEQVPDFSTPSPMGNLTLSNLLAKGPVVLAFYFADFTPV